MKLSFTIILLFLFFQTLFSQVDNAVIILKTESKIDTISKIKISETKTHYYKADLTPWIALTDSGEYNGQNRKNGFWKEYPIDTTVINSNNNVSTRMSLSKVYKPEIIRLEGNYSNGQKDGVWKKYSANIRTKPFFWNLETISEYKDNMKNGKEFWIEPFSKDTMIILLYKNGEPIEQLK